MQRNFISHCMCWVVAQKNQNIIIVLGSIFNIMGRDPHDLLMNSKNLEENDYDHGVDLLTI